MLAGRKVLIGITGGIAAYKSALLVRLLVKAGAEVQVIMTPSASAFVSPLTLATLSKRPVLSEYFKVETGEWANHVELGLWPDLMLIAPLTANTLSKMVHGLSDNLLMTTYLSARCPVVVAPAMDLDMWKHATTRRNMQLLEQDGVYVIPPATGELASGLYGEGRMAEPEEQFEWIQNFFSKSQSLSGQKVLITAGPTYEALDPVRFIGNHSSGKMGLALAKACAAQGAEVHLVHGPVSIPVPQHPLIKVYSIRSAQEMFAQCELLFPNMAITICSAAVADYRPEVIQEEKIKKKGDTLQLNLVKNPDILKTLGHAKKPHQVVIGFALETTNELENAQGKLHAKQADLIVLNSMRRDGSGFGTDTNHVWLVEVGRVRELPLASKDHIAESIVEAIIEIKDEKQV